MPLPRDSGNPGDPRDPGESSGRIYSMCRRVQIDTFVRLRVSNFRKIEENRPGQPKAPQGSPRDPPGIPKDAQGTPRGPPREPPGTPWGPQGPKGQPKESQVGPKFKPKAPQSQSTGNQNKPRRQTISTNSRSTACAAVMLIPPGKTIGNYKQYNRQLKKYVNENDAFRKHKYLLRGSGDS